MTQRLTYLSLIAVFLFGMLLGLYGKRYYANDTEIKRCERLLETSKSL